MKEVDISQRPGRIVELGDVRFQGASEYWFGPAIFNKFPRELLLSFSDAQEINELENGVIHIKLFDLENYWQDNSQQLLQGFKNHLKIDKLEKEFKHNKS